MKKTLLVVGDSFMRADPKYPKQHWSEMLPDFDVVNMANDGGSLALIHLSLYQGIAQHNPDTVVLGFTDPLRIEFGENEYYTSCHKKRLTPDQAITVKYFHATKDLSFQAIKGAMHVLGMLDLLQRRKIPYAYSLGLFEAFVGMLPDVISCEFDRHRKHQTAIELNHYHPQTSSPIFHVHDLNWQHQYVQSLRTVLNHQQNH